jgi:hypothetical protein
MVLQERQSGNPAGRPQAGARRSLDCFRVAGTALPAISVSPISPGVICPSHHAHRAPEHVREVPSPRPGAAGHLKPELPAAFRATCVACVGSFLHSRCAPPHRPPNAFSVLLYLPPSSTGLRSRNGSMLNRPHALGGPWLVVEA